VTLTEPRPARARRRRRRARFGATLRRSPMALVGALMVAGFAVLAFIHPVLQATVWSSQRSVYHPTVGYDPAIVHPSGPSLSHILGTDPLGRDGLSIVTFGLRPSFILALTVAATATILGLVAGTAAAALRGRSERVITVLADTFVLLPPPLLLLVVNKGRPDWTVIHYGIVYGIAFGMGPVTLVARSRALAVAARQFVESSRASGAGPGWITRRHLMPLVLPHASVAALGGVVGALITQGFIEFLGAGHTHRGSLGAVVYDGITYRNIFGSAVPWSTLLSAALTISLMAAAFYMISAGLREAMDPRLHGRRV
jgi:peptide/nickel transport system permease protein